MSDIDNDQREPASRLRDWLDEAGGGTEPAPRLATALRWPVDCDPGAWSARVALAASSLLQDRARRVWRRQVTTFLVAAAVALPLSAAVGLLTIRVAYDVLSGVLPSAVATYVIASYAMVALGIVGVTYAMIPLAIGRSRDRLAFAQAWRPMNSPESMELPR